MESSFLLRAVTKAAKYSHTLGTSLELQVWSFMCAVLKGQTSLLFMASQSKVSSALKDEMTEKCVDFVCADLRLHDTIAGQGFFKLAQHLVDTAAKIGKFDVKEILPHPTTLSRNLIERAQTLRRAVVTDLTDTIVKCGCAVRTDIWTENYWKTSFLSATIHHDLKWC